MTDRDLPVTEDELHVYVDGELAADRREAVERWLASHPDDAARVAAWRAQAESIRARYGAIVRPVAFAICFAASWRVATRSFPPERISDWAVVMMSDALELSAV